MDIMPKKPLYQIINGIHFPSMFSPTCIKEALTYKPDPDDIFIVTYPKNGTTWMQNIVMYIFRRGQPLSHPSEFAIAAPFIDIVGEEGVRWMPRPGAIKTHLPYTHMPFSPEAKYIFVARNPKDTCVSLYNHTTMMPGYGFSNGKFDDFFELFMKGEVEYNDYFDHLLSWFPHRNDKNNFFTTYETMKKDVKTVIVKLCHFLGSEYSKMIETDNNIFNNIVEFSSFQYMKDHIGEGFDSYGNRDQILNDPNSHEGFKYLVRFTCSLDIPDERPPMDFIRKGIVGDWKNYLSPDQMKKIDEKFEQRNIDSDIKSLWTV